MSGRSLTHAARRIGTEIKGEPSRGREKPEMGESIWSGTVCAPHMAALISLQNATSIALPERYLSLPLLAVMLSSEFPPPFRHFHNPLNFPRFYNQLNRLPSPNHMPRPQKGLSVPVAQILIWWIVEPLPCGLARGGRLDEKEVVFMELVPWRPFGELSSFRE